MEGVSIPVPLKMVSRISKVDLFYLKGGKIDMYIV